MSFSKLPRELLALIVENAKTRDALTLAATNHYYYEVLNNYVYSQFIQHDPNGNHLLQWTCAEGSNFAQATARRALCLGARVNGTWRSSSRDGDGDNLSHVPLLTAIDNGHIGMIDLLLAYGADPRARRAETCAMALAARNGNVEAVRLLIAALYRAEESIETDVTATTKHGAHSHGLRRLAGLHEAVAMGHDAVVRLLLDHGADANMYDRDRNTPLHMALLMNRSGAVRMLLDAGADPFAEDFVGESCLERALLNTCTQTPVTSNVDAQQSDCVVADFEQVLRQATSVWNARSPADHDDKGAAAEDFWLGKSESETHEFMVRSKGSPAVVKLLIETGGIPVDARSRQGGATPLWWFAGRNPSSTADGERDVIEVVDMLLDAGADINAQDTAQRGQTPLMRAAEARLDKVVALLLSRGARVDARDQAGRGVLACASQSASVLRRLLDHERSGPSGTLSSEIARQLDSCDRSGRTPLVLALWGGHHPDAAEVLIRAGADVLPRDKCGNDALSTAASYDTTAYLVSLFVEKGALVNPLNSPHPLLAAAGSGSLAGVKVLLEHGAQPDAGMTIELHYSGRRTGLPLICAISDDNVDIARALLEGGASVELALLRYKDLLDLCRRNNALAMIELLHEFGAAKWETYQT